MNMILEAASLHVGYEKRVVIQDVNIQALKGQVICLIGPNGAGKSTILRTLSGMLAPVEGTVCLGRDDIHALKPADLARQMAVVLTERTNLTLTTAYEVAAMGRIPYTGFFGRLSAEDHAIVCQSLETVGAAHLARRDYPSLSDGEKQKVLIARALAQKPSLIILDEPTSHLDIHHKIEVVRILNRLAASQGLTVVLALHDVDIAIKSCQFVLMVKDGQVVGQGRPEDVIGPDTIRQLYDIEGAGFDALLGSLELGNDRPPEIFVAAGAGTGIPVYRLLSRMGFGLATGILHQNDVDASVARSMGLARVEEKSFEPVSPKNMVAARTLMEKTALMVDAGFPLGSGNQANLGLLRETAAAGKPVLCLRPPEEITRLYGQADTVISIESAAQLQQRAEELHTPGG